MSWTVLRECALGAIVCVTPCACTSDTIQAPVASGDPQVEVAGAAATPAGPPLIAAMMPPSAARPVAASPAQDDAGYLGLAAPQPGFRLATLGHEVAPESELELCEVAEVPGAPGQVFDIAAIELANAPGSHHLIVSMAAPGSAAERQLRAHSVGEQLPCIGAQSEFGQAGISVLASIQTRYGRSTLPDGVGQRVYGGQRLVFDYHYFNLGKQPVMARSALSAHTLPTGAPITPISSLAFTNMTIDVPPGAERTFTGVCTLRQDAMLSGLARHTHQYGTDFSVWFEGGAHHGQHVWTSTDWEHDFSFQFPEPLLLRAGEGFKFACSFGNPGAAPLRFGIRASDEMCILGAAIWSPVPQVQLTSEECVITWVDAQGLGHDADAAGGFPAAEPLDALACHAGSLGLSFVDGCLGCLCDACGSIVARCNADADCKALLECTSGCTQLGSTRCQEQCEPQMLEHSSAVGMITQVGECIRAGCGGACDVHMPEAAP